MHLASFHGLEIEKYKGFLVYNSFNFMVHKMKLIVVDENEYRES